MKYRYANLLFLAVFFVCLSCAGTRVPGPPPEEPPPAAETKTDDSGILPDDDSAEPAPEPPVEPELIEAEDEAPAAAERQILPGLIFRAGEIPPLEAATGVGIITRDRRDFSSSLGQPEREALSEAFRLAYIDSLLRGLPLTGVLGGDEVHGWPPAAPSAWAQNWRGAEPAANSWGLPALVLAVKGAAAPDKETAPNRVFAVHGGILDFYGKNAGKNGANGNAGYGAPRGNNFVLEGKTAQRFDLGLISVDREGNGVFISENPPSLEIEPPESLGVFSDISPGPDVRSVFVTAWKTALDRGIESMEPDAPGAYLPFPDSGAKGVYVQSFNRQSVLLVLPDSPGLPPYPRFVSSPFLEPLLRSSEYYAEGGESLVPLAAEIGTDDEFYASLLRGFALYGIPMSDPVPVKSEYGSWREAQRFSRGWLFHSGTEEQETGDEIPEPEAPVIGQPE